MNPSHWCALYNEKLVCGIAAFSIGFDRSLLLHCCNNYYAVLAVSEFCTGFLINALSFFPVF